MYAPSIILHLASFPFFIRFTISTYFEGWGRTIANVQQIAGLANAHYHRPQGPPLEVSKVKRPMGNAQQCCIYKPKGTFVWPPSVQSVGRSAEFSSSLVTALC